MANLTIRMFDASRNPLDDVVDIEVRDAISGDLSMSKRKFTASSALVVKNLDLTRTRRKDFWHNSAGPIGPVPWRYCRRSP